MNGLLYGFLWVMVRGLARVYFRLRIEGQDRIPTDGGVLFAANHASYLDIPLLGCGVHRRLWYMGRRDLFPIPGFKWLFRGLGWIPIRPDRLDREGFESATDLIRSGKAVVIFPEGGRTVTGQLRHGKPGVGIIVAQTRCPVVPVHIDGTFQAMPPGRSWPRPYRVTVRFGDAMDFTDVATGSEKAFYYEVSRQVMVKIAELGRVEPPEGRGGRERSKSRPLPGTPALQSLNAEGDRRLS
ncbi:1-acyl-sn-glycerol-3-phosphate acyltransferase [Nitrospira sp.]|nr:1-acyl-sn-glycerol-3-phosphate acyltransferase [Nitrospira sp.]